MAAGVQPMRKRKLLAIIGVLFGSPICAEYLQAYLSFTGDAAWLLFGLVFFAPLYGGAALLIREAAVRSGRGWVGILLMAAAFGIVMPGVIDLAMCGEQRSDIPYWNDLRLPTLIPARGFGAFPMTSWVLGHVVMSIGTPLALLDGLVPSLRRQPLLRWWGDRVLALLFAAFAWIIHKDGVAQDLRLCAQRGSGGIRYGDRGGAYPDRVQPDRPPSITTPAELDTRMEPLLRGRVGRVLGLRSVLALVDRLRGLVGDDRHGDGERAMARAFPGLGHGPSDCSGVRGAYRPHAHRFPDTSPGGSRTDRQVRAERRVSGAGNRHLCSGQEHHPTRGRPVM